MNITNLSGTPVRSRRALPWSHLINIFVEWRRRARARNELMGLDERTLRDIGLSRDNAAFKASKPFWLS